MIILSNEMATRGKVKWRTLFKMLYNKIIQYNIYIYVVISFI